MFQGTDGRTCHPIGNKWRSDGSTIDLLRICSTLLLVLVVMFATAVALWNGGSRRTGDAAIWIKPEARERDPDPAATDVIPQPQLGVDGLLRRGVCYRRAPRRLGFEYYSSTLPSTRCVYLHHPHNSIKI
ncbi:unnamed protein product [Orchesella dallaii]|uniref:Uncharacterized protein n=1 Tax=Orchesella dallaii TaxID=48710 RepID=A0ABP1PW40_9HEXA